MDLANSGPAGLLSSGTVLAYGPRNQLASPPLVDFPSEKKKSNEDDLMPVCAHCPHTRPVLPLNSLSIDVEVCPEAAGSLLSVERRV
ncbi:hypothetical protein EYF80_054632 [Liparis tanakae]|uniref:Uncharacterized protein n=1 Tax=Liparis tanakae TaxID=230148 RepID=A0A4Z2F353_9TELE|nr:hypothetical protein EYF80_054632 [Liparis tanakae]